MKVSHRHHAGPLLQTPTSTSMAFGQGKRNAEFWCHLFRGFKRGRLGKTSCHLPSTRGTLNLRYHHSNSETSLWFSTESACDNTHCVSGVSLTRFWAKRLVAFWRRLALCATFTSTAEFAGMTHLWANREPKKWLCFPLVSLWLPFKPT